MRKSYPSHLLTPIAFLLLWAAPAWAQITVPAETPAHRKIVATCRHDAAVLEGVQSSVRYLWETDAEYHGDGAEICLWAAPGEHKLECIVIAQTFTTITVWVPDADAPDDVSKAKRQTVQIGGTTDVIRHTATFRVGPAKPPDPVDPDDPPPPPLPGKPTAVVYVYEKDQGGVPPSVSAALNKLNASGLRATTFEEEVVDGSGQVPEQYRVALPAAQAAGLPALVVMSGQKVLRVVKSPVTQEQVLEAVGQTGKASEVKSRPRVGSNNRGHGQPYRRGSTWRSYRNSGYR